MKTTAKTNVNHIEQARAEVTFNGKKAVMTLDWEKPTRFYIHVRGMGVNKVIAEEYDPRAILMSWTRAMKKHGGELVARTPKQRDLQQKQHQLAADFRDSQSNYYAPGFLRELRKAYLMEVREGKPYVSKWRKKIKGKPVKKGKLKVNIHSFGDKGDPLEVYDSGEKSHNGKPIYVLLNTKNDQAMPVGPEDLPHHLASMRKGRGRRYPRDPFWIKAKYPGVDIDGKPFKKGAKVLYWPNDKKFMQGPKAEQAWRDFQAQIADEVVYNAGVEGASIRQAISLKKFYMTEFRNGDRLYIYPNEVMKNKSLKGYEVDEPAGYSPGKAKKRSFRFLGPGFKEVAYKDLPPKVQKRFQQVGVQGSVQAVTAGDKDAYRAYFEKKMKAWGIKSPEELDDAKKKKFFEEVDKGWKGKDEKQGKARDYAKEYRDYHSKPEQKKNRAKRNSARRQLGLEKGDSREVDHKTPLSKGGGNGKKNLRAVSRKTNRQKGDKQATAIHAARGRKQNRPKWMKATQDLILKKKPQLSGKLDWDTLTYMFLSGKSPQDAASAYLKTGAVTAGDKAAYKAYFDKKMKEWGIKSPAELDDAKKKKFFEEVDKGWKGEAEGKMVRPEEIGT